MPQLSPAVIDQINRMLRQRPPNPDVASRNAAIDFINANPSLRRIVEGGVPTGLSEQRRRDFIDLRKRINIRDQKISRREAEKLQALEKIAGRPIDRKVQRVIVKKQEARIISGEISRALIKKETGEVQPAPKVGFIQRQERERERLRTKKQRGQKLTLKEEGILVGRTVIQGVGEFGQAVILLPETIVNLAKDPSQLKKIGPAIRREGKNFGKLIRVSPTEAFAQIGTEIFLLKGTGKALKVTGQVGNQARAAISPKFKKIKGGEIEIKTSQGKTTLRVGGTVKKIQEPLSVQAQLAGQKVTAVSAQADALLGFIRSRKIIRKPIPGEETLSKPTKRLLSKFDKGTISKKELIFLEGKVPLLERSFFADPRGRFRPSRLGAKQKEATFFEFISEDITFKTSKPQVLVFQDIRVQKFPKNLIDVEKSLKSGKTLTESQARRLLDFQNKKSGKFKPIGALTREPEITLAPGEIIKREKVLAKTIIDGRVVEFVKVKVVKPTTSTKKLLKKEAAGKITSKELAILKKKLRRETGFKEVRVARGRITRDPMFVFQKSEEFVLMETFCPTLKISPSGSQIP